LGDLGVVGMIILKMDLKEKVCKDVSRLDSSGSGKSVNMVMNL
jgi:hypothetical protein